MLINQITGWSFKLCGLGLGPFISNFIWSSCLINVMVVFTNKKTCACWSNWIHSTSTTFLLISLCCLQELRSRQRCPHNTQTEIRPYARALSFPIWLSMMATCACLRGVENSVSNECKWYDILCILTWSYMSVVQCSDNGVHNTSEWMF